MKRNIPYIVLAAIIIGIIVAVKPWKNDRTSLEEAFMIPKTSIILKYHNYSGFAKCET